MSKIQIVLLGGSKEETDSKINEIAASAAKVVMVMDHDGRAPPAVLATHFFGEQPLQFVHMGAPTTNTTNDLKCIKGVSQSKTKEADKLDKLAKKADNKRRHHK